jgi:glycosyltransferase involved in cell wall biosynthesis
MSISSLQPLISIVTPSFNQSSFLGEALRSVSSQTYPNIEHLVLDGGSTDGSRELLEGVPQGPEGHSLWWRSFKDDGQSAALNEGFARATGDIIGWLNADDRYRSDCIATVMRFFNDHPEVDLVYGDYTFMDTDGRHVALRREIEFSRFVLRYHRVLYVPTAATFFRRRIFDDGHFLKTSLHYAMDLEFFLRLSDAGYRFQHLAVLLADFRIHPASKSVAFRQRQRAEHRSVVLSTTPLRHRFKLIWMRKLALHFLRFPAGLMRYSEKLCRGYYLPLEQPPAQNASNSRPQEQV